MITISLKFVPKDPMHHTPSMAGAGQATDLYPNQWWPSLLTHICVTWAQWVKSAGPANMYMSNYQCDCKRPYAWPSSGKIGLTQETSRLRGALRRWFVMQDASWRKRQCDGGSKSKHRWQYPNLITFCSYSRLKHDCFEIAVFNMTHILNNFMKMSLHQCIIM